MSHHQQLSRAHRLQWGQVFTPEVVADTMLSWLAPINPKELLDPALGLGVFPRRSQSIKGLEHAFWDTVEKDPVVQRYAPPLAQAQEMRQVADYFDVHPMKQYDGIIANPPYLSFHRVEESERIVRALSDALDVTVSTATNSACLFLLKSITELAPGGRLAYLLPSELFTANYGRSVREVLKRERLLRGVVFFECEQELFPDAMTTACLLLCEKPVDDTPAEPVSVVRCTSLLDLPSAPALLANPTHRVPYAQLPDTGKWRQRLLNDATEKETDDSVPLSEYGRVIRGRTSGNNGFFALSSDDIERLKLPLAQCQPCITKSSQIMKGIFDPADFTRLCHRGAPVYHLNVTDASSEYVSFYLAEGEDQGIHRGYLLSRRTPWYQSEARAVSGLWLGVFHRGGFKVIRNRTDCRHYSCYHALYGDDNLSPALLDRLWVFLFSEQGQSAIAEQARQYGRQLDKLEPSDWAAVRCPPADALMQLSDEAVERVIASAQTGDNVRARALATGVVRGALCDG